MFSLEEFFTKALNLDSPWRVDQVDLKAAHSEVHFKLLFGDRRAKCPACGAADQPIHDTRQRQWQHLHFFQFRAFLHADVPRIGCSKCGKTTQLEVPWAKSGSGFTLMFTAFAIALARVLPVAEVGRQMGVRPQRLWKLLTDTVIPAYHAESFESVRNISIDETAMKRGHDYVTVIADVDARRVIFATEGKDALTVSDFASELRCHQADPAQIENISMDMSKAFISGAKQHLPNAKISFDPFHVVALASQAVDQVRRAEVKTEPMLRKQRFSLLKDPSKLNERQSNFLHTLQASHLDTARAWRIKETLRDIVRDKNEASLTRARLTKLTGWMQRSRLEPLVRLCRTIKEHMEGIVRAISERRTNGFAEGLNSAIQAAKSRARGFKSPINFICVIYLIAGKLAHLPANPIRTSVT